MYSFPKNEEFMHLLQDRQDGLSLLGRRRRGVESVREMCVRHTHGVVPPLLTLFLRLAHLVGLYSLGREDAV